MVRVCVCLCVCVYAQILGLLKPVNIKPHILITRTNHENYFQVVRIFTKIKTFAFLWNFALLIRQISFFHGRVFLNIYSSSSLSPYCCGRIHSLSLSIRLSLSVSPVSLCLFLYLIFSLMISLFVILSSDKKVQAH